MAWQFNPVVTGATPDDATDYQRFVVFDEIRKAIQDRDLIVGQRHYPPVHIFYDGVVSSIVDNEDGTLTITDTTKALPPIDPGTEEPYPDDGLYWDGIHRGGRADIFWVDVDTTGFQPPLPRFYDVCVQVVLAGQDPAETTLFPNPMRVVRGQIVSNTSRTLTITNDAANHVTAGTIPAVSALAGCRYSIVQRANETNDGGGRPLGVFVSDRRNKLSRMLDWPNGEVLWKGMVTAGGVVDGDGDATGATGWIRDTHNRLTGMLQRWEDDRWVFVGEDEEDPEPYELLVFGNDDDYGELLYRLPITASRRNRIYFGTPPELDPAEPGYDPEPAIGDVTFADRPYLIVKKDTVAFPDRRNGIHRNYYGGIKAAPIVHVDADDQLSIGGYPDDLAAATVTRAEAFTPPELMDPPLTCDDTTVVPIKFTEDALDRDPYSPEGNFCGTPDMWYAPKLHTTIRAFQVAIEKRCGPPFIEAKEYTSITKRPPYMTIALAFNIAGVNAGSATVAGPVGANYHFEVPPEYAGATIWWTIVTADQEHLESGTGVAAAESPYRVDVGTGAEKSGLGVLWTAKWTRYRPTEIRFLYNAYVFIPDLVPTGETGTAPQDPPAVADFCHFDDDPPPEECARDCAGVGAWHKRPHSTKVKDYSDYGYATDARDLRVGEFVRYVGNNASDGVVAEQQLYFATAPAPDTNQLAPFWDHADERYGTRGRIAVAWADRVGTVTGVTRPTGDTRATKFSFTDVTKDWCVSWFGGNNTNKLHTFTATAGSTTTFTTDALQGDTDDEDSSDCWWDVAQRFLHTADTFPFSLFILEVDKVEQRKAEGGEPIYLGDGSDTIVGSYSEGDLMDDQDGDPIMVTHTYQRPITNVTDDGTKKVIHFPNYFDGFSVDEDDVGRIREPKWVLNRFENRRVRIFRDGAQIALRTIKYTSHNTAFWTAALDEAPKPGDYYVVEEYYPGGVWKVVDEAPAEDKAQQRLGTTNRWLVRPEGEDPRGSLPGNPAPDFLRDPNWNLPSLSDIGFGRMRKGDYIYHNPANDTGTFIEMYKVLNVLRWTITEVGWLSRFDPEVPETNYKETYSPNALNPTLDDAKDIADASWGATGPPGFEGIEYEEAGPPYITSSMVYNGTPGDWGAGKAGRYAYPVVTGIPTLIACDVDVYTYGAISSLDPDDNPTMPNALVFESFGFPISFREWQRWDGVDFGGPSTLATRKGTAIGSVSSPPGWPSVEPVDDYDDPTTIPDESPNFPTASVGGAAVVDQFAILRWDVAGGLTYVD